MTYFSLFSKEEPSCAVIFEVDKLSQIETRTNYRRGVGRFSKFDGRVGIAAGVTVGMVAVSCHVPTVTSDCDDSIEEPCLERPMGAEFDKWKESAVAGALFALHDLQLAATHITIENIVGFTSVTSPAAVGVAAALAVFEAVEARPPVWFISFSEEIPCGEAAVAAKFIL